MVRYSDIRPKSVQRRRICILTDHTPTGPESVFAEADVDDILNTVKANALPTDGAA